MKSNKAKQIKKIKKTNSIGAKLIKIFKSKTFKTLMIITVLLTSIVIIIGALKVKEIVEAGPQLDTLLSDVEPEGYKSFIYDQQGNILQELHSTDANRVYVEYDQIPDYLGYAYVSIEDERFFKHSGIDYKGVLRAIYSNITKKK